MENKQQLLTELSPKEQQTTNGGGGILEAAEKLVNTCFGSLGVNVDWDGDKRAERYPDK